MFFFQGETIYHLSKFILLSHREIVIKDPNRIKQMLYKVKFPAPKWGESLSDKDFIDKVKNICFNDDSSK